MTKRQKASVSILFFLLAGLVVYVLWGPSKSGSQALSQQDSAEPLPEPRGLLAESGLEEEAWPVPHIPEKLPEQPDERTRRGAASSSQAKATTYADLPDQGDISAAIDLALAGSLEQAVNMSEQMKICNSGYKRKEQVEQMLSRWGSQMNFSKPVGFSWGGLVVQVSSFDELNTMMRQQFAHCTTLRKVTTESLHDRVTRMAQEGDAIARYLYAMWPPPKHMTGAVQWVDWLEYQDQAMEFTWNNMVEGEPLGLMALAQSYSSNLVSYFTPSNPALSEVLLLAAFKCGLSVSWLDLKVGEIIDRLDQFESYKPGGLRNLNTTSEEMVQVFCNQ